MWTSGKFQRIMTLISFLIMSHYLLIVAAKGHHRPILPTPGHFINDSILRKKLDKNMKKAIHACR